MSTLRDSVREHYFSNIKALPLHKQFHLCSRLAAWEGDERARRQLARLRSEFVGQGSDAALETSFRTLLEQPMSPSIHAQVLRRPFFAQFPRLRGTNLALFRLRHLSRVYGVDARTAFGRLILPDEMLRTRERLLEQPDAVRMLSTYAVNFLSLLRHIVPDEILPADWFYDLADEYDPKDSRQAHLFIYLYTHCIIGDSDFYIRPLTEAAQPTYRRMLARLERLMSDRFQGISLDAKLEFLVCARMCGYRTTLSDRILAECRASVSPTGTFLIDRHNGHKGASKTDLASSEHRNVLFIMSGSGYTPHSTLV